MADVKPKAVMDFDMDLCEHLRGALSGVGYDVSGEKLEDMSLLYFTVELRMIAARPRAVHVSKSLVCPDEHKNGFEGLRNSVTDGADLAPYQSTRLRQVGYHDAMLFDWGIHHFHLGVKAGDGSVPRTGPVLYAMVTDEDCYCISILDHGGWANKDLIQIVRENWPFLIERYRLPGVTSLSENVDEAAIKFCRKYGIQTMVDLGDGVVYAPAGGGYVASGDSTRALMTANWWHNRLGRLEKTIGEDILEIVREVQPDGLASNSEHHFKLDCKDWPTDLWVVHQESGQRIPCITSQAN